MVVKCNFETAFLEESFIREIFLFYYPFTSFLQKSYKYGCGLISAAEKGRRSFQLDSDPSSTLLSSHTSSWEKLLSGAKEVGDRLKMARHFHSLSEEVREGGRGEGRRGGGREGGREEGGREGRGREGGKREGGTEEREKGEFQTFCIPR